MKLAEMLLDCSLAAVAAFLLFPVAVEVAAAAPAAVAAFAGAGVMIAIWGE
jgi:hypothetical protein